MNSAIIGYTGFVGGNIARQTTFTAGYNSRNIENIKGKKYNLIVSAGTSSLKWKANLEPEADWKGIKRLIDYLQQVKTDHFILISTIDVYPAPHEVDEDTPINESQFAEAYGYNRYQLEKFIKEHFKKNTIIRLPQLFGHSLKKNFIFDLIHNHRLDFTHKNSRFQWYNLQNIWKDISITVNNSIPLINFAIEPLTAKAVARYTLNMEFRTITKKPPVNYNFWTKYARLFNSSTKYLYTHETILPELRRLILNERKKM